MERYTPKTGYRALCEECGGISVKEGINKA